MQEEEQDYSQKNERGAMEKLCIFPSCSPVQQGRVTRETEEDRNARKRCCEPPEGNSQN